MMHRHDDGDICQSLNTITKILNKMCPHYAEVCTTFSANKKNDCTHQ